MIFASEGVRFISEEMFVGAAAMQLRRSPFAFPLRAYLYSPYEGGSLFTAGVTAVAQLFLGDNLISLKIAPLLLGMFSVAAVYRFLDWLGGRKAAIPGTVLMLLPPINVVVQELYNEGNHYDSTGFSFICLLLLGQLAEQERPARRRLFGAGVFFGLSLWFAYQVLPLLLVGLFAWSLAHRRKGLLDSLQQAATMAAGTALGVAPHLAQRVALNSGLFGIYGPDAVGDGQGEVLGPFALATRTFTHIWQTPFRGDPIQRPLPLPLLETPWVVPLVVGTLLLTLLIDWRSAFANLKALVPRRGFEAGPRAAFGVVWMVLFLPAYSTVVELNPQHFAWYHYPSYPVIAAALGGLCWLLLRPGPRASLRLGVLAIVAALWLPIGRAHLVGARDLTTFWGGTSPTWSRGWSASHFSRFFIYNLRTWRSPSQALDGLQRLPTNTRTELFASLGQGLGGHLPQGLEERIGGWERVAFFRGFTMGDEIELLQKPGAGTPWTRESLPPAIGTPGDPCAMVGRWMGAGMTAARAGRDQMGDALPDWWWFGFGIVIGHGFDKDITARIWSAIPRNHQQLLGLAEEAGPHRDQLLRGVGYGLGLGGTLAQHRELPGQVPPEFVRLVFQGVGMARQDYRSGQTWRLAGTLFGEVAAQGFVEGVRLLNQPRWLCHTEPMTAPVGQPR